MVDGRTRGRGQKPRNRSYAGGKNGLKETENEGRVEESSTEWQPTPPSTAWAAPGITDPYLAVPSVLAARLNTAMI